MMRHMVAALVAGVLVGCAAPQRAAQQLALTAEHFAATAEINDDSLETVAIISTRRGNDSRLGLGRPVWSDAYLRALVTKRNGEANIQLVFEARYEGQWRFYNTANFMAPDGPRSVVMQRVAREVDSCRIRCSYYEAMMFLLPEKDARAIALMPGDRWQMKVSPRVGEDVLLDVPMAELQGLLTRLDQYRAKR
jgi:hypothetical protein